MCLFSILVSRRGCVLELGADIRRKKLLKRGGIPPFERSLQCAYSFVRFVDADLKFNFGRVQKEGQKCMNRAEQIDCPKREWASHFR